MNRARELYELTRVRVLLFVREPEALFWVFLFPIVLAAVLGFAFRSRGVQPARVALVEGSGAEELAAVLAKDPFVEVVRFAVRDEAARKLARAAVDLVIEPEPGSPPRLTYDSQRPEGENARVRVRRALDLAQRGDDGVPVREISVQEKGSRYLDFLFPGLLGMNVMGTGMWGIGFAIADTRRRKFLKRLLVTPMRRSSFFLSFILARLVFLVFELTVLGLFGRWILGVPLRGSLASFALVALLGAFAFAGMGILVASRVRTIEAVSGLMNLVMMPMWLGSGVFFSYERFPAALQPVLRALPLTALNDALRGVYLDGDGPRAIAMELGLLAAWAVLTFGIALRIFRWE